MKTEVSNLRQGGDAMLGFRHRRHQFAGLVHNTLESAYLSGTVILMILALLALYLSLLAVKAY
jgi:hypothetical protein